MVLAAGHDSRDRHARDLVALDERPRGAGVGALAGAGAAFFLGGDTQAVVAGAIGGAFAGGIAGASLGLGPLGAIVQEGLASGLGGLVGDFANLRPGQKAVSLGEVGRLFAVRSLFGAAGSSLLSGLGPITAPGWAGFFLSRISEVIVGGACGIQGEFLAN